MGLGRRKVSLHDPSAWVFNRMAEVYDARPGYPDGLVAALGNLAVDASLDHGGDAAILDLGAGVGHLALPLAERGLRVTAVEPAVEMLAELRRRAASRGLAISTLHAAAEAMPVPAASQSLVVVADALHFLDAQHAAEEIARVLRPGGALAVVTWSFDDTPFMRGVARAMEAAVPRRPRALARAMVHLGAVTGVSLGRVRQFHDQTPVSRERLGAILRSISFIGPAMNPARFAAFRAEVHGLPEPPVWSRIFTLRWGHRLPSRRALLRALRTRARNSPEVGDPRREIS
jgi:ubiquinone/menaquinone biosynthesis C-methylase UbiE